MVAYLCEQFPAAARRDDHISEIVGGRTAERTQTVDAAICKITQFPHWCRDPSITIHPLWRSEFGREIRDYVMNRVQHQDKLPSSSTNWVGAITGNWHN